MGLPAGEETTQDPFHTLVAYRYRICYLTVFVGYPETVRPRWGSGAQLNHRSEAGNLAEGGMRERARRWHSPVVVRAEGSRKWLRKRVQAVELS